MQIDRRFYILNYAYHDTQPSLLTFETPSSLEFSSEYVFHQFIFQLNNFYFSCVRVQNLLFFFTNYQSYIHGALASLCSFFIGWHTYINSSDQKHFFSLSSKQGNLEFSCMIFFLAQSCLKIVDNSGGFLQRQKRIVIYYIKKFVK